MINRWSIYCLTLLSLILLGCAAQGRLSGGPKDEDPPKMDSSLSTKNFQTNFKPNKIELEFDEFIEIKNAIKEIGVSPPLKKFPKVTSRGKKLIFEFAEDEVLKEDATYSINFGSAIRDYHEGNILENFSFVFSTGDEIDSLSISGNVVDALERNPVDGAVVLLYDNLSDTAVYSEKPFYFAKTDDDGNFQINNIKEDTFALYAINDENLSYTWDEDIESIAFIKDLIFLNDSLDEKYPLIISKPWSKPKVISVDAFPEGKIKVAFTSEPDTIPAFSFSEPINFKKHIIRDSLFVAYDTTSYPSFKMYINQDTFKIKPKRKKKKKPVRIKNIPKESITSVLPSDSLTLTFDFPIIDFIKDNIVVKDTSGQALGYIAYIGNEGRSLILEPNRIFDAPYSVTLNDSSLISYNSIYNDSLDISFAYVSTEKLGTIHLALDSTELENPLVVFLMDGETELNTYSITNEFRKVSMNNLLPKTYKLRIINDRNGNGKWDAANFKTKEQPERIIFKELDKLKENWELEVNLSNSLFDKPKTTKRNVIKGR